MGADGAYRENGSEKKSDRFGPWLLEMKSSTANSTVHLKSSPYYSRSHSNKLFLHSIGVLFLLRQKRNITSSFVAPSPAPHR